MKEALLIPRPGAFNFAQMGVFNVWSLLTRTGLCASLVALCAAPFAPSLAAAGLTMLLCLPFALLATLLVSVVARPRVVALGKRHGLARSVCVAMAGGAVFILGAYVSNVALVDDPLQSATLIGYGISCGAALIAAVAIGFALRQRDWGRALERIPAANMLGLVAVMLGIGLVVLDASFLTEGYFTFHLLLLALALVLLGILASIATHHPALGRIASASAMMGLGLSSLAVSMTPASTTYVEIANSATVGRRLLLLARRALDRDGDGFAAVLGGGDCDDRDANAFPLSSQGRDCLDWVGHELAISDWAPPSQPAAVPSAGPRVILLITVDALRCDSNAPIFAGLPPLCASLDQLAREGHQRVEAYTTYPSTAHATASLHAASPYPRGEAKAPLLAESMRAYGRKTHAVSTHAKQMPPSIARSFQTVDRSLQPIGLDGSASSSKKVTERTLDWLTSNQSGPVFVWAHYYDPHSPYVDPPGSLSALSAATERYAAEVRRTDREVARLVRSAAALEPNLLAVVTADHGEAFAEHGNLYHGTTLYEAAVRIPMIVWSPRPVLLATQQDLPVSLAEVGPFLIAAAGGGAFTSRHEAFFWVASQGKRLVGIYRDGYKLTYDEGLNVSALYHVATDPAEEHNLENSKPALRQELGAKLAAYLQPLHGARAQRLVE